MPLRGTELPGRAGVQAATHATQSVHGGVPLQRPPLRDAYGRRGKAVRHHAEAVHVLRESHPLAGATGEAPAHEEVARQPMSLSLLVRKSVRTASLSNSPRAPETEHNIARAHKTSEQLRVPRRFEDCWSRRSCESLQS